MEDYEETTSTRLEHPSAPRHRGRRWLLIGGLAFAFMLALGIGTLLGSTTKTTQAAAVTQTSFGGPQLPAANQGDFNSSQSLAATPGAQPGARGQCESVTVSSVNGNTIIAKKANGSSVTIHTTANTKYNQAGKTVAASALKAGVRISVMGTHNSDGSITATSIDLGR